MDQSLKVYIYKGWDYMKKVHFTDDNKQQVQLDKMQYKKIILRNPVDAGLFLINEHIPKNVLDSVISFFLI